MLLLNKASAGSGKTFFITWYFICLALQSRHRWRHILAVTFTNDAAAEMKRRILSALEELSEKPECSKYLIFVQKETGLATEEVRKKCREILYDILQHLDQLQVVTLDSFFQRMLRAFSREIGLNTGFELELNSRRALSEVVREFIHSLKAGDKNTERVTAFALEKVEDGRHWNIRNSVEEFGMQMFTENFQTETEQILEFLENGHAEPFMQELEKQLARIEAQIKEKGSALIQKATRLNMNTDIFSYKAHGGWGLALKAGEGSDDVWDKIYAKRVEDFLENPEKWVSKSQKHLANTIISELFEPYKQLHQFISENYERWAVCKTLLKHRYQFGLMGSLLENMAQFRNRHDMLLLADAAPILRQVTAENPDSFIFEKIGNYFQHFIIDEFQDTSRLQWENFKPLIINSTSENNRSAIVGDVKQAIYRFRNGDWRLLSHEIQEGKDIPVINESLTHNFRSLPEIIRFNNALFEQLPKYCADALSEMLKESKSKLNEDQIEFYISSIIKAYNGHAQEPSSKDATGGYITLRNYAGERVEEKQQQALELLTRRIKDVLERGYRQKDICILVEKNQHASLLSRHFEQIGEICGQKLGVLTQQGLALQNHAALQILTGLLEVYLPSPDKIRLASARRLWLEYFEPEKSSPPGFVPNEPDEFELKKQHVFEEGQGGLYSLCRQLISQFELEKMEGALPFLHQFLEIVGEKQSSGTGDIAGFLSWWHDEDNVQYLASGTEGDTIRIMTIHKSKGLEFPVVILFMITGTLVEKQHLPVLWLPVQEPGLPQAPIAPVELNYSLLNSGFGPAMLHEITDQLLDSLNRFYVACTRASRELHIHLPKKEENAQQGKNSLAQKIWQWADNFSGKVWKMTEDGWDWNEPTAPEQEEEKKDIRNITIVEPEIHCGNPLINALEIAGPDEWLVRDEAIRYGIVLHQLLAGLNNRTDSLERILDKALRAAMIYPEEKASFREKIQQIIQIPELEWSFAPDARVISEGILLHPELGMRRPDRVAERNGVYRLYDFKTGIYIQSHERQIHLYLRALSDMGLKVEGGYLIYTENLEVKPVL